MIIILKGTNVNIEAELFMGKWYYIFLFCYVVLKTQVIIN